MSNEPRWIPQRELRNDVGRILREVEAGSTLIVTVSGHPVAEIGPIHHGRRFAPRAEVERIVRDFPLDDGFEADVLSAVDDTLAEP